MADLKLEIGGSLPGEKLATALLEFAVAARASMSEENRNLSDKILLSMLRGWHNWWISIGWPGEKV